MVESKIISVYVLQSKSSKIFYVGIAEDVKARLEEHNRGKSKFTKGHLPWELIYFEEIGSFSEARKKEKYYKSTAGKNYLRKIGVIKD